MIFHSTVGRIEVEACCLLLLCWLAGCTADHSPSYFTIYDLSGVPISDELKSALESCEHDLKNEPSRPDLVDDMNSYVTLLDRIRNVQTRHDAGDELYATWRGEPTHFLWIDLAIVQNYLLHLDSALQERLATGALADTMSAVHAFATGRPVSRYTAQNLKYLHRAEQLKTQLDPFQQIWLVRHLARAEAQTKQEVAAVRQVVEQLPEASRLVGAPLLTYLWQDIARYLKKIERLDDALHAATFASYLAQQSGWPQRSIENQVLIGEILIDRRAFEDARVLLETGYDLAIAADNQWLCSRFTNRLSIVCNAMGDYTVELDYDRKSLAHALATEDRRSTPRIMLNIAEDYRHLTLMDSCYSYLERATAWLAEHPNDLSSYYLDQHQARYFHQLGEYAIADSLLDHAATYSRSAGFAKEQARLLLQQIRQGLDRGHSEVVYQALDRANRISDELRDTADVDLLCRLEIAAADFLADQGELRRAQEALDRATKLVSRGVSESVGWEVERFRGELARRSDDIASAAEVLQACLDKARQLKSTKREARTRFHLGHLKMVMGQYQEARALFRVAQTDSHFGGSFRTRIASQLYIGTTFSREGRYQEALIIFDPLASESLHRAPRDLVIRLHTEMGICLTALARPHSAEQSLHAALTLLRAGGERAYLAELQLFDGQAYRDAALALIDLYVKYPSLLPDNDLGWHTLALAEEARAAKPDPDASARSLSRNSTSGRELSQLEESTTLVFFTGEKQSYRWLVKGRNAELEILPGRQALRRLILPVLIDMEHADIPVDPLATDHLSRVLLGNIQARWPAGTTLRIIPDGLLHSVPWAAISLPGNDSTSAAGLVLDHGPIVEILALNYLATGENHTEDRPSPGAHLLAIGVDSHDESSRSQSRLPLLRHAEAEAARIASIWRSGPSEIRIGADASWTELISSDLSCYDVIHIATHAVVHQGLPNRSTIRLAEVGTTIPITVTSVADLDLNASLVYLSACDAARRMSEIGTGLQDFAQAFLSAGTETVIAPIIRIDDEAALYLAIQFYQHWTEGMSKPDALRAAQLDLRQARPSWEHPYYWAFYRLIEPD